MLSIPGAAYIIAGALAAFSSRRRLSAVPPEHRTPEMLRAERDINIGIALLMTGLVVAFGGAMLFPGSALTLVLVGLGCFGALGLGWLWSGRQQADAVLEPFDDEAPWGTRAERRRHTKHQPEPPAS